MNKKLNCYQVSALMNFYIEGTLTPALAKNIEDHLKKCSACQENLENIKKIRTENMPNNYSESQEEKLSGEFINNLSAYVDNELNPKQNVRIKKLAISNVKARERLDKMYNFRQLLQAAYNRTKNNAKIDFSKQVISHLQSAQSYSSVYFNKLTLIFALIIITIVAVFLYLYF